jgi:hypothetical protein
MAKAKQSGTGSKGGLTGAERTKQHDDRRRAEGDERFSPSIWGPGWIKADKDKRKRVLEAMKAAGAAELEKIEAEAARGKAA